MGYTFKMVCLHALVILCILSSVNGQCAEFEITGISNSKAYTVTEGVHFKLPFSLNTERCPGVQTDYTIIVSKSNTQSNIETDVCRMRINSTGKCFSFRPECVCEKEEGHYSLSKIAERSDATLWTWKVSASWKAAEQEIQFIVKDSPSTKHPTTSVKASYTTLGPMTTGNQGTKHEDTSNSTLQARPDIGYSRDATSPLIIGIVIAVVVIVVIIAIVATVLAVRRRRGLPLFRRASGQRDPINFRRPDSKMPEDNQEGYLYPTSLNQTAPEEVLDMTPRPPPRTAINPEYEFEPQSGTMQRFEV